ncbi:uncharacterized protein KY384_002606 [Bacidia gigantensis]|uniref:uncharacterized protein n=1 Tax=Bacidia gigantensis TaxID=2732470 RepID=UPI001D0367FC|nr:uncharacterized protein KY384_002606 [Bacidia gigantensis]KAG8532729.1 hypothetical protein KY384_002606 [Bacidia gigantensis]
MDGGWHGGEALMQKKLHVPFQYNPTSHGLSPHSQRLLHGSSLLAIGALDDQGQLWTTVLAGKQGFARSLGQSIVGVKALADVKYDPVVDALFGKDKFEGAASDQVQGKDFAALGIHLATRDRVKLQGQMIGTAIGGSDASGNKTAKEIAEIQLALAITGSLGNCPKYLNEKEIVLTMPKPVLEADTLPLTQVSLDLLAKADLFFITSYHSKGMSANHRGGSPGFMRVEKNDAEGVILVYPEFSGNRFYQTLGNLYLDPRAGFAIPDFDTGDILYITCTTKILIGDSAAATLPRSNLAVQLLVKSARYVKQGLAFRGILGERSPYNPPVRYLPSERNQVDAQAKSDNAAAYARLLSRTMLTHTIARFRFSITDPETAGTWKAGQYIALAFEDEVSGGYAHMNDEDPRSLNDDYLRTFTVSSPPGNGKDGNLRHDELELTVRNVGTVTNYLFKVNTKAGVELPLRGFGGTFSVEQPNPNEVVPFVAGGIGITPLLAQLGSLDLSRLRLLWSVNVRDLGLVVDMMKQYPLSASTTKVYVSGLDEAQSHRKAPAAIEAVKKAGAEVIERRILEEDVRGEKGLGNTWYFCTGPALKKLLLAWLKDKTTIYEDFNY